ncbi:MAG: methionyl-tRNA formyltransferase [Bacteroidota bacterium]|nr:methionyl-tRNA formyltransferase [Bacteroidota bacterium]
MNKDELRIIYMGTPDFAVEPLKALVEGGYQVVAVITMPDKPSGRGMKLQASPVKKYSLEHQLPVLQPEKLKNPDFLETLRTYKADLQIVVAFRMLPEIVWAMPRLGTFNLHASLLPNYRGAAPIHWAVMNGETETGVTTFFLQQDIDTGDILLQEKLSIGPDECTGSVHDRLMVMGAGLVTKTVDAILEDRIVPQPQATLAEGDIKPAPKLFKENTRIDWSMNGPQLHNLIRGLSPHPVAWSELWPVELAASRTEFMKEENKPAEVIGVKVFEAIFEAASHNLIPGTIVNDGKKLVKVAVGGGFLSLKRFQLAGRKALSADEFLRGFNQLSDYCFR